VEANFVKAFNVDLGYILSMFFMLPLTAFRKVWRVWKECIYDPWWPKGLLFLGDLSVCWLTFCSSSIWRRPLDPFLVS